MPEKKTREKAARELGVLRLRKIEGLADFFGMKLWRGNLAQMREDSKPHPSRRCQ